MGNNNVSHRDHRRISLKSPFLRRFKSEKNNLSHTFSLYEDNTKIEKLNINLANEEELMTLPEITRETARAIVEHRKAIGRFKKVEDLALVRGVGAVKLEQIRPEICVNKSCTSSRAPSVDSLRSSDSRLTLKCSRLIDVNKATVFELQCVHGITQEVAAAIVHHRNKRGCFKELDDLINVRSINRLLLSNICCFLTVDGSEYDADKTPTVCNGSVVNGYCNGTFISRHYKMNNAPIKHPVQNTLTPSALHNIYELLSAYSHRPILEEDFKYRRNGVDAIRVATWNLHSFTEEKANNFGVKEVICRTILENKWSFVVMQEILEPGALKAICEELNYPQLQRIIDWKENSQNWNFCMLNSHLAVLYDKSTNDCATELVSLNQLEFCKIETLVACFSISGFKFVMLNVQIPENLTYEVADETLKDVFHETDCVALLGDFTNMNVKCVEHRKELGGLQAVLPLGTNTASSGVNMKYSDNILVNVNARKQLTGNWGMVREGLTHLAIPNGWSWGGTVSPHCPLWAEFYIQEPPL